MTSHRQIWITRNGGPESLEIREFTPADPAPGEVRVSTRYSGINFADIVARMGLYPDRPPLPTVVGYEVSGVIDAVGEGVTKFAEGDEVVALVRFGGYSTSVNVPAGQVSHVPDTVSLQAAAALPVQWLTAWLMLIKLGNVQAGERALIHSLGGGVGLAALQICQWRGAEVFGTASKGKHERLSGLGADHCIDYRNHDFEEEVMRITSGKGVHIILDAVGGESFKKGYRCLTPMGRLFMFGASATSDGREKRSILQALKVILSMPKFKTLDLINDNKGVFGINLGHLWEQTDILKEMLEEIISHVEDGTFAPVVDKVFPFDEVADAHRYIQDRKNFGKVLLEVEG